MTGHRIRLKRGLVAGLAAGVWALGLAAPAADTAADPQFEARVNRLAAELRCLVCQNQSLADSNADLALDLKNQVRGQLRAGRSEREVIDYMTQRYGDFVLYRPPFKATTWLLWIGPVLFVIAALASLVLRLRRAAKDDAPAGLDAAALSQAGTLLEDTSGARPPAR